MLWKIALLQLVLVGAFAGTQAQATDPRILEMIQYGHQYTPDYYIDVGDPNPYGNYAENGIGFYSSYIRHPVLLKDEFTFQRMIDAIQKNNITTVEGVIDILPEHMKDQNYVLMYRSRSLQEATPQAPRAILYTPTAAFMLSFNGGDPSLKGSQTVETIQFDPYTSRFEFHELTFDGIHAPKVSAANPTKCLECHQSSSRSTVDMRPNWEPYATWVGAFGSDDGDFNTRALDVSMHDRLKPQDQEALAEQKGEFELFKTYINEIAPAHPRYSKLGRFNLHGPVDLSEHVTVWNLKRVVRLIANDPVLYPLYREALAWTAQCYASKDVWQTDRALKWLAQFQYPQYYDFTYATSLSTSMVLTQLFEPLGVDTSDWSTDFGTGGRFAFYERMGTPSNTEYVLKYAWASTVPDAKDLQGLSCDQLQKLSLAKLDAAYDSGQLQLQSQLRPAPLQAPQIYQRCLSCHAEPDPESRIPTIPFNQPDVMAKMLLQPATTHPNRTLFEEAQYRTSEMATQKDQMPPLHRLSETERSTLMNYLKEIAR